MKQCTNIYKSRRNTTIEKGPRLQSGILVFFSFFFASKVNYHIIIEILTV